jgi:hypothetical protein
MAPGRVVTHEVHGQIVRPSAGSDDAAQIAAQIEQMERAGLVPSGVIHALRKMMEGAAGSSPHAAAVLSRLSQQMEALKQFQAQMGQPVKEVRPGETTGEAEGEDES